MKKLITVSLILMSALTFANVMDDYAKNLESILNAELLESQGQVSSLKCINHFVGVLCPGQIEFKEDPQLNCEETYYYLGFGEKVYQRLCSTCWFAEGEEIFKPTCD